MTIWSSEIKELERLNASLAGRTPLLEKEIRLLLKTEDENVAMLYSRRCLEVIVTDLCETELKRPRKTEPLKGIIDKLNKEEKVPSYIITSMHGLNSLSTYGAHPKDFDPEQVKPGLNNLNIIIKWYLQFKGIEILINPSEVEKEAIPGDGKKKTETTSLEKSIAVLPFINDSPDQENTYFINGVMEEILNNLQKIKDLRVISRTSAEKFRGQKKAISEIAGELDVNYIVEGSGQKYGKTFRLRTQLIKAERETHLWAESFQKEINKVTDIFNIQIQIAETIAAKLEAVITPQEKMYINKGPTENLEAYDAYLRGYSYAGDLSRESLLKARDFLKRAIEKDPNWAPLYAALATVWLSIGSMGVESPEKAVPIVYEYLNKALELDPDLADTHYVSAFMAWTAEWNWEKAETEFKKALEINPNHVFSHIHYSHMLYALQRPEEAKMQADLAYKLDPLNPLIKSTYGVTLLCERDCSSALSVVEDLITSDPDNFLANNVIEPAAFQCGDLTRIFEAEKHILPLEKETLNEIEKIYINRGFYAALDEIMKQLEILAEQEYVGPADMAFRYYMLNQYDKVIEWIEKGAEVHDPTTLYIGTGFCNFTRLYDNPRFIAALKKMNLPLPKAD